MNKILVCIECTGNVTPRIFLDSEDSACKIAKFAHKEILGEKAKDKELVSTALLIEEAVEEFPQGELGKTDKDCETPLENLSILMEFVLDVKRRDASIFLNKIPVYSCESEAAVEFKKGDKIALFAPEQCFSFPSQKIKYASDIVAVKYDKHFSLEKALSLFCEKSTCKDVSEGKDDYTQALCCLDWKSIYKDSKKDYVYYMDAIEFAFLTLR